MLQLTSQYHRFINWPDNDISSNDLKSRSIIKIDLPDIEQPYTNRSKEGWSKAFWFELYLKVMYGQHELTEDHSEELFAVSQISDIMICPDISNACDTVLSNISYSTNKILPV